MAQLRALPKLIAAQVKLLLREPMSAFFSVAFAPSLLILLGLIFGNEPSPMFAGRGQADVYVPAYASIVIGVMGIMIVPIETTSRREAGILRRFRATPLRPLTYIAGDVVAYFVLVLLGIALVFLVGTVGFGVAFSGNVFALAGAICLSATAFLAIGYVLAGVLPSPRVAPIVGNLLLYPLMIFSGVTVPLELMPQAVRTIAHYLPLTSVALLMRGLWFGEPASAYLWEIGMLAVFAVVGTVVAVRVFRWE